VPFFSCAASEFVELFVGVGASRVRDLFEKVCQHTICFFHFVFAFILYSLVLHIC